VSQVELKNIYKVYPGNAVVVDDVNLVVNDREFVVLVGPSGCGKSTTLSMIAGLEEISDGELRIDGELMNDVAPKDRNIAMVFQSYALYPHMSVQDNMAFALEIKQVAKPTILQRVLDAAKILDIEKYLQRKPKALSGGQRQRVAVGRAIVRQPKVFLFDEPLSNLDAKLRVQMRAEIIALHKRLGATMIYVTHDQVEAMTMGDKIVVMKDGIVQQIGAPLHVYNHPANKFVAGFIGSPPMNFFSGRVENRAGALYFGDVRVSKEHEVALAGQEGKVVTAGIRPEDFYISSEDTGAAMSGEIIMIEPLGGETQLHLKSAGGSTFIAKVDPENTFKVGEKVTLRIKNQKMKYFDDETGYSLVDNVSMRREGRK
jgi:multiple sugar transport system ATP-binding protein